MKAISRGVVDLEIGADSLSKKGIVIERLSYCCIDSISDFREGCGCIVIKSMNPDFYLLLGSVKAIISEKGSELSHLAIVAREQGVPVLIAEGITKKIQKHGVLSIKEDKITIEN